MQPASKKEKNPSSFPFCSLFLCVLFKLSKIEITLLEQTKLIQVLCLKNKFMSLFLTYNHYFESICVRLFTTNNIVVLNSLAQIEILGQKKT